MNAHPAPIANDLEPISPRRRLLDEYSAIKASGQKGGWRAIANRRRVNVRYVYNLAVHGKIPQNKSIRKRLGFRPTLNDQFRKPIQDMPPEILRFALEYREEMQ